MYRVRERYPKLELFYRMFIKLFCHYFLALGLITCLNGVLKLSLHIPKRFDAFQVLKWFLLLLEVTCVIFARATNTDVWQAIIARATKSRKNCSKDRTRQTLSVRRHPVLVDPSSSGEILWKKKKTATRQKNSTLFETISHLPKRKLLKYKPISS